MVDLLHHIGLRLSTARENADMSIEQAASAVLISPRLLENYEAGQQNISVVRLVELAKAYKVSPEWLIRGDAEVDQLRDPDLPMVSRSEWGALTQDEQQSSKRKLGEARRQPMSEKNRVAVKERVATIEEEETRSPRSRTAVTLRRSTRDQIRALRDVARRTDETAADEVMAILTDTECESEVRTAAARALGSCWNAMAVL